MSQRKQQTSGPAPGETPGSSQPLDPGGDQARRESVGEESAEPGPASVDAVPGAPDSLVDAPLHPDAVPERFARHGSGRRPRVVLVLGGGGMKGFSHIGVIRGLERMGLQVDEVIGTSMGALIGSLHAAGLDSHRIEELCHQVNIKDYFKLQLMKFLVRGYRHPSVYKGKVFRALLEEMLPIRRFDELEVPFFCNALSITTGTTVYFGLDGAPEVPLVDAVYASCALPGIFEPMLIGEEHFIDGGMVETIGLRLAQARRADLVVGVDLSLRDHHKPTPYRASLPHILFQTYDLMGAALNEASLHHYGRMPNLVMIKPKVMDIGLLSSVDVTEVVRRGEIEAIEALSTHALTRYLCDPEQVRDVDRVVSAPRDYVHLDVDMNACVHCGICSVTCATDGFADVPLGDVVRKLHNYECTRDAACERNCPTKAIRLRNM